MTGPPAGKGGRGKGGRQGRGSGGGGSNPKPKRAKGGNKGADQGGQNGEQPRSGPVSKQMREIQISQRVLLECKQAVDNLKSEQTLDLVKQKHVTQLVDRLKARLTPALCSLYAVGFDPSAGGEQTEGMKCLEDLRESQNVLTSVQDSEVKTSNPSPAVLTGFQTHLHPM